jgi:radical S-adenosyl methionine domain-containing protein 2
MTGNMGFTLALLSSPVAQLAISLLILTLSIHILFLKRHHSNLTTPISVNYHFTRKCNKTCKFCFHTEKSSHVVSDAEMMRGLRLLKEAGMRKINFAGGEPFLYPKKLGWLCRYYKEVLGLESVSIITNGTKVTEEWLGVYGGFVDVMGVSCDSFDEKTGKDRLPGLRCCCEELADFFIAVRPDVTALLEFYLRSSVADLLH